MRHTPPALLSAAVASALLLVSGGCRSFPQPSQGTPGGGTSGDGSASAAGRPRGISRYVQGVRAMDAGDPDRATDALEEAVRQNPELIMARLRLGDIYRQRGDYRAASQQYLVLTRLDPYESSNFYKLGVSYQFLKELQDSAKSYRRSLELEPANADANMNLGLVYLDLGRIDEAVRFCERATILAPRNAAAFSNLGVALDVRGDLAGAETAYRRALDLDPTIAATQLDLAMTLVAQNKTGDAVSIMRNVLKTNDTAAVRKRYGDALQHAGRYDEAIAEYGEALARNRNFYPALNETGWTHIGAYRRSAELDDARRQAAVTAWKKSLVLSPDQPKIQNAIRDWSQAGLFGGK